MGRRIVQHEDPITEFQRLVERISKEAEARRKSGKRPSKARTPRLIQRKLNGARPVNDQLIELGERFGIRKKDVACAMAIDPSYLSQLLARGVPEERIGRMAHAVGVEPQFFDEFVAQTVGKRLMNDRDLLDVLRAYLFEANENTRIRFLQRAQNALANSLNVNYLGRVERRRKR